MSKALLPIVTHNLVIGLVSKGSPIAFDACVFMVNLNMHIYKSNDALPSHGGETSSEGLTKSSCGIETW